MKLESFSRSPSAPPKSPQNQSEEINRKNHFSTLQLAPAVTKRPIGRNTPTPSYGGGVILPIACRSAHRSEIAILPIDTMKTKKQKAADLMPIISLMPPLSHWPDRSIPFSPDNSHVVQWIANACAVDANRAEKIRRALCSSKTPKKKCLSFDPSTKLWTGTSFRPGPTQVDCRRLPSTLPRKLTSDAPQVIIERNQANG
jgi:hypothetical protein